MESGKRIVINTAAQYTKAIINTFLSLFSTRIILDALDISDYGIFSVVGGTIAMLGFINAALVITTQRYISFYLGKGEREEVRNIFSNSLFLHILCGIILAAILLALRTFIIHDFLNIPSDRLIVASRVYDITVFVLVLTILIAPFKALFIARENIVYISIVEVVDGVIKLVLAISLLYVSIDRLLFYTLMMAFIQFLNLAAFSIYGTIRFEECHLIIHKNDIQRVYLQRLLGFAGWTTYGMGAITIRNQGTAMILNHFFGTVVNAAYGVAFQIYAAISFVSSSILNAMNPQIMKAEGSHDREKMLSLAFQESKFSFSLLAIVTIPIIFEMPNILEAWLKEVPVHTSMFCTFILISCLADQITIGLHAANQATGHIRNYSLLIFTPKLMSLILFWFMLTKGYTVQDIMVAYLLIETVMSLIRLPYMKHSIGMEISKYVRIAILPLVPLCIASAASSLLCVLYIQIPFRFILTFLVAAGVGLMFFWKFTLSHYERSYLLDIIQQKLKKK